MEMVIRGVAVQRRIETEHLGKGMVDPHGRRRATEKMEILREPPPDLPTIGFGRSTVDPGHAEVFEGNALRAEHPENVVVGHNEKLCRIREAFVLCIPAGIGMAMRADDRQSPDSLI